ncbi:hypothetical protein MSP8886_03123 [Marinomonas spartinae]|uniref:DUF2786 domain-containing protein n=1 Tax=Marinomonas spartinae TaxID=1792290 RepID=A0A1A8TPH7_9GAMM|nr:DUF2786 domain-containing protein [Marinomonas spartinae]SBS34642.1 hypothetical protein MSP8886_03123 [Marinomonas spartinae]
MNIRRRKKAISKVVKLLNLATSTNSSESVVALRHAESLIRQYSILQRELPILQLCDTSMLYRVSWGGAAPRHAKEVPINPVFQESVSKRRFSEKTADPSKAYASVRTILDDIEEGLVEGANSSMEDPFAEAVKHSYSEQSGAKKAQEKDDFEFKVSDADAESNSEQAHDEAPTTNTKQNQSAEHNQTAESPELNDDKSTAPKEKVAEPMEDLHLDKEQPISDSKESTLSSTNVTSGTMSSDNVIDAAQAFRPNTQEFADTLRTQYSTSDPTIPFSDDKYWSKVYERLADFDEAKVKSQMDALKQQLQLAEEKLLVKKSYRLEQEQEELQERSERARIEQSFEEAMERAFQARAKAHEAWEQERARIRLSSLRDEQEALHGFESLTQSLNQHVEAFKQHLQRKEDYRAAKIMHELRNHLALAVSSSPESSESYATVLDIMQDNGLSLKDLEFSDIKNKSLFIRLLERETAQIDDIHQREIYTEEMLDKFLTASASKKESKASENPIQHIQRLLIAANEGGQFETQKNLEQVIHLMDSHGISVRDVGYEYIKKYSVFIRLINWEAESISSLSEREAFTAGILEEYVQHSVQAPAKSSDKSKNKKTY